jgi:8-oxo-dGTP pyrophosphatase MutT (NUDIX family)
MPEPTDCLRQAAALAVWGGRVCLITSSSGKRWILPKGMIEASQSAAECARQEAWEEAGVRGELHGEPLGRYRAAKWGRPCEVTVFLLRVTEAADDWPERTWRRRRWVAPADVPNVLCGQDQREIVEAAQSHLLSTEADHPAGVSP